MKYKRGDYVYWKNRGIIGQITDIDNNRIYVKWENINSEFVYNLKQLSAVEQYNLQPLSNKLKLELL